MAGFFGANNETSTMSQLCESALNFCPGLSVRIAQFTDNKKPALLNAVFMELRGKVRAGRLWGSVKDQDSEVTLFPSRRYGL